MTALKGEKMTQPFVCFPLSSVFEIQSILCIMWINVVSECARYAPSTNKQMRKADKD